MHVDLLGLQKLISREVKVPLGRPTATPSSSYTWASKGVMYDTTCCPTQGVFPSSMGMKVEIISRRE